MMPTLPPRSFAAAVLRESGWWRRPPCTTASARACARLLKGIDIVDATDLVDRIKAVKSPEERACIGQVAAMQDEVMKRVREFVRPGLKDYEVAAYAQYVGQQLGSEQGIFLCSSAPWGQAASFRPRSMQGRTHRARRCLFSAD